MKKNIFGIICFVCFAVAAKAQDTLPNFTIKDLGKNKIQISWINPFPNCVQVSIQRSYDKIKFFRTIYSSQSPELPQNGFVDTKVPPGVTAYYRIFYVLDNGSYSFSVSKSQFTTSGESFTNAITPTTPAVLDEKQMITVYKKTEDNVMMQLNYSSYEKFRDSLLAYHTNDTLQILSSNEVLFKPFTAKYSWKASPYVFTNNNSNVNIVLPKVNQHNYKLIFFEETGAQLFEIKHVKESPLTLDKTNFIHAGWFYFELYEDDKIKERNKFYLEKEF
jgi:hypothetical protein